MSEASTMYEEVNDWITLLKRFRRIASEMESHEQDPDYLTQQITEMFEWFEQQEPVDDELVTHYTLDFEHPDNPGYKLVFEFKVRFDRAGQE